MASDHLRRQAPPLYPRRAASNSPTVFSQSFHEETIVDEEDRVLFLLLEAFPGISHETLAIAYARADRDPNKAADILSAEAGTNGKVPAQSYDLFENVGARNLEKEDHLFLEKEEFSSLSRIPLKEIHSDDISCKEADTHQLKNGHGDFAGASVWRDSSTVANHSRPPEMGTESLVAPGRVVNKPSTPEEHGNRVVSVPALRRSNVPRSSKTNWGVRSSSAPPKLSAVAGSVSNRMQRRASVPSANGNGSELTGQRRAEEVDDGLYSEKMVKKKNKVEDGKGAEEDRRRAAEDFLHSMLGGDFGIDLVRDVLAHYEGDTDKALETLLNITASGFDYSRDAVHDVEPLLASLTINEQIEQTPDAILQHPAGLEPDQATDDNALLEGSPGDDDRRRHRILLVLCRDFPAVEQSFLGQVLQAAEFSYEAALVILKESGMTPVGERNLKSKLDPNEILQALFKTEHEPPAVAGPFNEPLINEEEVFGTTEEDESWSAVVAKSRTSRNPETQVQKLRSDATAELDEYNEYYRQRASANEHWETMKMYMKEANAAHNRGDRVRAGVLSGKGAKFKELARASSNRASQNIFNVRNKNLTNNITIDLHSQHVAEALSLLNLHLKTLSRIPSVNGLTVITGQGSHSAGGQAKIKPAVTRYLDKKKVPWTQDNPGCVVIKMVDVRKGMDSDCEESYSDGE